MTNNCIELIKHFEGLHDGDLSLIGLQPKMCPAGIWTEGYGHAMTYNGSFLRGIENKELAYKLHSVNNENEAMILLKKDIEEVEKDVLRNVKIILKPNQLDALISHSYNCGISNSLYSYLNKSMCDELKSFWLNKYTTAGGVKLNGLVLRRKIEYNLFSTGVLRYE